MALWPPNLDDIVRCIHRILGNSEACDSFPVSIQNTDPIPTAICQSICLHLDTYKENHLLFGSQGLTDGISYLGLCVPVGAVAWSDPVELEDVKEIAFTVQRIAGHCGLSVIASLETSPDNINWDSLAYAGFTNCVFGIPAGLTDAQATLPITTGPKYMRE
ncbi:unnamed protein product, partial [marine sediment metagenome]